MRLANPQARKEAITARPLLVRLSEHAGRPRLLLTLEHGASDKIKLGIGTVRAGLDYIHNCASVAGCGPLERVDALQHRQDHRRQTEKCRRARAQCPATRLSERLATAEFRIGFAHDPNFLGVRSVLNFQDDSKCVLRSSAISDMQVTSKIIETMRTRRT